jgi:hypothetical protein
MVLDTKDCMNYTTIKEQFAGTFTADRYDASYHDANGFRSTASEEASHSFSKLTAGRVNWSQVHGDFKNVVKRGLFEPYPHWPELYACCKAVLRGYADLHRQFLGDVTRARLMGDAMTLLRAKHGHDTPRWWLPIMNALRNSEEDNDKDGDWKF